jgi:carbamoylphosphate synthase small subunit
MYGGCTLDDFLKHNQVPGIPGIDTGDIAIRIRTMGTLRGAITEDAERIEELIKELKRTPFPSESNLVEEYLIQHGIDTITRKKHSADPKYMFMRSMEEPPKGLDGVDKYDMAVHSASLRYQETYGVQQNILRYAAVPYAEAIHVKNRLKDSLTRITESWSGLA